jgi:hypothetical protein
MNDSVTITLRNVETADISIFFEQQLDPEANRMAAFVREDPHDRAAFDAHWKRIMDSAGIVNKTILRGEEVAGHISCYPREGELEVTYWLGKKHWARESQLKPSKNCFKKSLIGHFSQELRKTTLDRSACYKNAISRLSVKTRILHKEEVKKQRNIFSV